MMNNRKKLYSSWETIIDEQCGSLDSAQALSASARSLYHSYTLLHAAKVGLFDHTTTWVSAAEVTANLRVHENQVSSEKVTRFLNALVAMGLLGFRSGKYRNKDVSDVFLTSEAEKSIRQLLIHYFNLSANWRNLDYALCNSYEPEARLLEDEVINLTFVRAMRELHHERALHFSKTFNFSGVRNILDLGGGGGIFAECLVKNVPAITVTIADYPLTIKNTRSILSSIGFDHLHRIKYHVDCFFSHDTNMEMINKYDLIICSYVTHCEDIDSVRNLFKKFISYQSPGGKVVVIDYPIHQADFAPLGSLLFDLNMLVSTPRGMVHAQSSLINALRAVGYSVIECLDDETIVAALKEER